MGRVNITVIDDEGKIEKKIELPDDIKSGIVAVKVAEKLGILKKMSVKKKPDYVFYNKTAQDYIRPEKTFSEEGVRNGHVLKLYLKKKN